MRLEFGVWISTLKTLTTFKNDEKSSTYVRRCFNVLKKYSVYYNIARMSGDKGLRSINLIPRIGQVDARPLDSAQIRELVQNPGGTQTVWSTAITGHIPRVNSKQTSVQNKVQTRVQSVLVPNVRPIEQESSIDVILKSIDLLDEIQPTLCNHLYKSLFTSVTTDKISGYVCSLCSLEKEMNTIISVVKENGENCASDSKMTPPNIDYRKYFEEYDRVFKLENVLSLISFSSSPERYITTFIKGDGVKNMSDQINDVEKNYDISRRENIDAVITISKQNFLDLSLETYPDDEAIVKQFLADLPRNDLYINGAHITNIDKLILSIGAYNRELMVKTKNRKTMSTVMLAIAFVCQSSFFLSFLHLHSKCEKMHSVVDQSSTATTDVRRNYHVSDMREREKISITVGFDKFQCSFLAKYRVVDVTTEKTVYIVKTEILIDMNNDTGVIIYETM
ncbi:hypothetical protein YASMINEVIRUS_1025 [Yasminevirus sp. GU-2018]|uniref:Uncharacterized protein n=1 Tax=Yasminevirus sp. GU-2018 TaxID=2420051 RepID=A0A5K0UAM8_9VIRU|nr:hypothetical protein YASMINEVIRUS_1025 [Yasminevirus sp. GU-2018]